MKTRARLEGEEWVLNGTKQLITNGDRAETFVVMAVTDPEKGKDGVSAFAIERGTPGFSTGRPERKLGMRSSDTVSVHLDNVRIPKDQLLGKVDRAFDDVKKVLERGRVMISGISIGLARGALEDSIAYAHERKAFGKPIADFQAIQGKIADMATRLHAARLMLYEAANRLDLGEGTRFEAAATKLFCSEMATQVCMEAIQIHGGYGYLSEYNVERAMRDAKLCEIGEGTSEILRVLVARAAPDWLGIDLPERGAE
jgi:alkylation response protein AidB-like acyl-CoA dehydrogenase